jgi:hypothetical protein
MEGTPQHLYAKFKQNYEELQSKYLVTICGTEIEHCKFKANHHTRSLQIYFMTTTMDKYWMLLLGTGSDMPALQTSTYRNIYQRVHKLTYFCFNSLSEFILLTNSSSVSVFSNTNYKYNFRAFRTVSQLVSNEEYVFSISNSNFRAFRTASQSVRSVEYVDFLLHHYNSPYIVLDIITFLSRNSLFL